MVRVKHLDYRASRVSGSAAAWEFMHAKAGRCIQLHDPAASLKRARDIWSDQVYTTDIKTYHPSCALTHSREIGMDGICDIGCLASGREVCAFAQHDLTTCFWDRIEAQVLSLKAGFHYRIDANETQRFGVMAAPSRVRISLRN
jgi:hypothetical protein